jgi:hypothetical protein
MKVGDVVKINHEYILTKKDVDNLTDVLKAMSELDATKAAIAVLMIAEESRASTYAVLMNKVLIAEFTNVVENMLHKKMNVKDN